jgi:hypothetical protein
MQHSLTESLGRIVRRVLRTQSCRTSFETRVLEISRRLADSHREVFTKDSLAKLIVHELMRGQQSTPQLLGASISGSTQFGTQVRAIDTTSAL